MKQLTKKERKVRKIERKKSREGMWWKKDWERMWWKEGREGMWWNLKNMPIPLPQWWAWEVAAPTILPLTSAWQQ